MLNANLSPSIPIFSVARSLQTLRVYFLGCSNQAERKESRSSLVQDSGSDTRAQILEAVVQVGNVSLVDVTNISHEVGNIAS